MFKETEKNIYHIIKVKKNLCYVGYIFHVQLKQLIFFNFNSDLILF